MFRHLSLALELTSYEIGFYVQCSQKRELVYQATFLGVDFGIGKLGIAHDMQLT
jgi:hypothetical protein